MAIKKTINCEKFSKADLYLFIESIEEITRLEQAKKVEENKKRAMFLVETMRFLGQTLSACCSSTLSSTDQPEEESVIVHLEQKQIRSSTIDNHSLSSGNLYYYSLPANFFTTTELQKDIGKCLKNAKQQHKVCHNKEATQKRSKFSFGALLRKYCKKYFGKKTNKSVECSSWTRIYCSS